MIRWYMGAYSFKLLAADGAAGGSPAAESVSDPAGDPQAGSTPAPETPQAGTPNPQAGTGQSGSGDEPISLEKARELRSENKNLRTRLNELEQAEAARQKAEKDAADKKEREQGNYQKLLADRETELEKERASNKALALKYEAVVVAQKLNISKPEVALRLIDQAAVEYDAEGKPANLEKLFKAAIEELPALADSGQGAPGSGYRPPPAGSSNQNPVQAYHDQVYALPGQSTKQ